MTKVIENLELLKKLQPYLEDMETEYVMCDDTGSDLAPYKNHKKFWQEDAYLIDGPYKTLTLEEVKKLITEKVDMKGRAYIENELSKYVYDLFSTIEIFDIKMAEKILEYLIDNDLLGIKNK